MNTTARLEQTSRPGRIQVSKETTELLIEAGKEAWAERRVDVVEAKVREGTKASRYKHAIGPNRLLTL